MASERAVSPERGVDSREREAPPEPWIRTMASPSPSTKQVLSESGQAIAVLSRNRQTIHDDERLRHVCEVEADMLHPLRSVLAQIDQHPARENPDEPHRPKILDHERVLHPARKLQREGHLDRRARGQGEHAADGARHGVGTAPRPRTPGSTYGPPAPKAAGGSRRPRSRFLPWTDWTWWDSSARWPRRARSPRPSRRRASRCARETASRR